MTSRASRIREKGFAADSLERFSHLRSWPLADLQVREYNDAYHSEIRHLHDEKLIEIDDHIRRVVTGNVNYWETRPWLDAFHEVRQSGVAPQTSDIRALEGLFDLIDRRITTLLLDFRSGRIARDDIYPLVAAPLSFTGSPPLIPGASSSTLKPLQANVLNRVLACRGWERRRSGTSSRTNCYRRVDPINPDVRTLPVLQPDFDAQGRLTGYVTSAEHQNLDEMEARLRARLTAPTPEKQKHLSGRIKAVRLWQMADPSLRMRDDHIARLRFAAVLKDFGFVRRDVGKRCIYYKPTEKLDFDLLGWISLNCDVDSGDTQIDWKAVGPLPPHIEKRPTISEV